ncbi:MAG: TetR/AcrR family transcriptional regulator [Umezawaea sp.]
MEQQVPTGPRARYREQIRAEVRAHAWDQIEDAGASALSLKAIAKKMGMTAPALYRYFGSRDELLTELILSTYEELAVVAENAPEGLPELASALRGWALANPRRYLLLYGTPVPGYAAPPEATVLASRILAPVVAAFPGEDGFGRALSFWTRVHGVLSLEVAGHFEGMGFDTTAHFDHEVRSVL